MREVRQPGQGSDGHAGGPSRRNATPKASPSDPQRPTPAPGEDSRGPSQPGSAPDASATDPRYAAPAPGGHAGGATQPGSGPEVSSRPTPTAPDRARGVRPLGPVPDPFALEALGLAEAPRDHPLLYPGAWPADSGLLDGDRLLPLDRLRHEDRVPVLAVGSNASPAQLRHKMAEYGITSPIPMVRTRVTGIDIGVSAHVSLLGYVSASPVDAPSAVRELFVTWLDAEQLAVIDASEGYPCRPATTGAPGCPPPRYGSSSRTARDSRACTCTSTATASSTTAPAPRAPTRASGRCSPNSSSDRPG